MKQARVLPGWGVNLVLREINDQVIERVMGYMGHLRFSWVRYEFDLRNPMDSVLERKLFRRLVNQGIRIHGLVHQSISGNLLNLVLPHLFHTSVYDKRAQFLDFVEKKAGAHKRMIEDWEVLNEPNTKRFWVRNPNHREYMELLRQTQTVLKRINPGNRVILGGICGDDMNQLSPAQQLGFLKQLAKEKVGYLFDATNFHPYGFECYVSLASFGQHWQQSRRRLEAMVAYSKKHFRHKPIIVSEFGISPRWVRLSTAEIAKFYIKLYRYLYDKYGIPVAIWSLVEDPKRRIEPLSPERFFHLLSSSYQEMPLYTALKAELGDGRQVVKVAT